MIIKKVLYVTTEKTYLSWENECIVLKREGSPRIKIPAVGVESVVCFGNTTISSPFIYNCGKHGITITLLSENGKFYGKICGETNGNVLLRQQQYLLNADPAGCSRMGRTIVLGKLHSEVTVLKRAYRELEENEKKQRIKKAYENISELALSLKETSCSLETSRGIEGSAAKIYFGCFDDMLKTSNDLNFEERSRRPPKNEVNAVLSFVYALAKNDIVSALETEGLDPACGFMHSLRPGRPALALDMMEEFRAPLCDRFVLRLFNLGMLKKSDFVFEYDRVTISDKARKLILQEWAKRKKDIITHPFIKEKMSIAQIFHMQAKLMAKAIRNELDNYVPFVWQ